jgi:hypothetical protein
VTLQALIREAANAHTRLNTFYAVIEILEGAMPGGCPKAARTTNSIIRQCKAAAQVQLTKYDAATEAIEAAFLASEGRP